MMPPPGAYPNMYPGGPVPYSMPYGDAASGAYYPGKPVGEQTQTQTQTQTHGKGADYGVATGSVPADKHASPADK